MQVAAVPSSSMEPALHGGDRIAVAKAAGASRVGDVVVFERPAAVTDGPSLFVKRVVALAGQTVEVADGRLLVDGRPAVEHYLADGTATEEPCGPRDELVVPPGTLYVLGDNRADSTDSRCFGPVRSSLLVGSVTQSVWGPPVPPRDPSAALSPAGWPNATRARATAPALLAPRIGQ